MLVRAATTWLVLLVTAFVAAAVREGVLRPWLGDPAAHVVGTLAVVLLFTGIISSTVRWIVPSLQRSRLLGVGTGWAVATVLFEFVFGHYVMGHSWTRLLADYDLLAGRLWLLVPLTVVLAPAIAGERQRRRLP